MWKLAPDCEWLRQRELIQNVRYISLHDRDTSAPLYPRHVFAARFGDCKEQSQMLTVMLREVGVKAGVAIVSWADSGDILEAFPSPWGNHTIVLATVGGQQQWIDPVFSHASSNVLAPQSCDRLCFVMDEKGPVRLMRTPKLWPEQNRIEQTTRVKVARDGSARGEREIIYRGTAAGYQRGEVLAMSKGARKEDFLKELQEFHERARVTKVTVDPRSLEDLDEPVAGAGRVGEGRDTGGCQDGAVRHWLAAALYQGGRAKEAIAAQREAIQRRPNDGELAEQLRRFEGAQR